MNKLVKVLVAGVAAAMLVVPVVAQDDEAVIIDSTFGSGAVNFNPITSTGATESQIIGLMLPALVGVNPETALIEPGVDGGLAESWDISEDGLTYTFHLYDNYTWSDGTPVTARDFEIVWDVITSGEVETNLVFLQDEIVDMVATDEHTLEVTFTSTNCEALSAAGIQPIPSHLFEGNFAALNDDFFDTPETLWIGPYDLASNVADQQTGLTPIENEGYPLDRADTPYVLRVVGDQTVQVEQFLAGEIDLLAGPPVNRRSDVRAAAEAGDAAFYEYTPGNSYDYMAFNLANPDNPQAAVDEAGNIIEQDPHPIFSDVRVRQALSMAVDVDAMIEGAVFGEGTRMTSSYAQGSWPYNTEIEPYAFDPAAAAAALAEAGWVDADNDPSTPLVAQGAMNAEDGTEFRFTLFTNQGNTRREAIGTIIQDQLGDIGVAVDFQTIDFNVLLDILDNQTYDAFILGWQNAYPFRADQKQLWNVSSDVIAGDNFTSYINPELDELFEQAASVPGCAKEDRAAIYGEIQEILHRDVPYMFLFSIDGMYAWRSDLQGVNPYPAALYWNINEWTKSS